MDRCFPAGTRAEALARLESAIPVMPAYAASRNRVAPGHPHVSRLSPAIRMRLITEESVVRTALEHHPFPAVEKFVQEVLWRGYWKGWLELRPQVWTAYRTEASWLARHAPASVLERARKVCAGGSGVAVMDRFARELTATGYLHNHARMWWASFWIHVERLPWQLGAAFFLRHLLDADPASNTLSWRWVAGLQTAGKAYLVRRSNLEKYCDPEWLADDTGLSRLDDQRVRMADIPSEGLDLRPGSLAPEDPSHACMEHPFGLWIHEEDALPEEWSLPQRPPAACFLLREPEDSGMSSLRRDFRRRALRDAGERAARDLGCECVEVDSSGDPGALVRAAVARGLKVLVTAAPALGPVAEHLARMQEPLAFEGITLRLLRRDWDNRLWPHAQRGFFQFWSRVSPWLRHGSFPKPPVPS